MKSKNFKAIAAAALMSAFMLTGCADSIPVDEDIVSSSSKINISADSKMETGVPMEVVSEPEIKPASSRKEDPFGINKDKKDEAKKNDTDEEKKTDSAEVKKAKSDANKKAGEEKKSAETSKNETASKTEEAKKSEPAKKDSTNNILTGSFYEINGIRVSLDISQTSDGNYFCKILESDGYNKCRVYALTCTADGSTLYYENGSYNECVYDENGNEQSTVISSGHSGTIARYDTSIIFSDSDGTSYVFVNGTDFVEPEGTARAGSPDKNTADEDTASTNIDVISKNNYSDTYGANVTLEIELMSDNTYFCRVIEPNSSTTSNIHTFRCYDDGSSLVYSGGTYSLCTYNEFGYEKLDLISEGHSGSIELSEEGLEWTDSDGISYTFI